MPHAGAAESRSAAERQEKPLVAIVIPVYNAESTIARSVGSALSQTERLIRVIAVDDASDDGSPAELGTLSETDDRLLVVRHERNRSQLEARRTGVVLAEEMGAEFVMFLDADDELAFDAVERALEAQGGVFDIVHFSFELRYGRFEPEERKRADDAYCRAPEATAEGNDVVHIVFRDRRGPWSMCGKLMRTTTVAESFKHIGEMSLSQAEDACQYFIVSSLAQSYKGMGEYRGYVYYIDAGGSGTKQQTMSAADYGRTSNYRPAMQVIEEFLRSTGRWEALQEDYKVVRREHAMAGAFRLTERVARNQRADAFDELAQIWNPGEVVDCLSEVHWEEAADLFGDIAQAKALSCESHPVKTVAAYHSTMSMGGAQRVMASLIEIWRAAGYEVVVFADEPRDRSAYAVPDDVPWVVLPDSFALKSGSYGERAFSLARALDEHGVDVFVHHQWYNPVLAWDALLAKLKGVPVCLYCHGSFRTFFSEANAREFDQARVVRYLDGIVALSEFDRRFWDAFNPRAWTTVNPITIVPSQESRSSLGGANIVWVGRVSQFDKQPQEALKIFARVASVDDACTLTVVGPAGSNKDMAACRRLAKALKIDDRVVFAGEQHDVSPYYQHASVHLLTSRFESYCIVLAESKAMGLPCVMYELPHLTLSEGERGVVAVPQGDADAAAAAVLDLLGNSTKRAALGQEAFEHVGEIAKFDHRAFWEDVFGQLGDGSPSRDRQGGFDAFGDELIAACRESLEKMAHRPMRSVVKQRLLDYARRVRHMAGR